MWRTTFPAPSGTYKRRLPLSNLIKSSNQIFGREPILPSQQQQCWYSSPESSRPRGNAVCAKDYYFQNEASTHNQDPIMGKKKTKRLAHGQPTSAPIGSQQTPSALQFPPAWTPGAGPMSPNGFNYSLSHQAPQFMNGFQQPFNMTFPQPNLYSGLQYLPAQQEVPNMHMGFTMPQPGSTPMQPLLNDPSPMIPNNNHLSQSAMATPFSRQENVDPSKNTTSSTPHQEIKQRESPPSSVKFNRDGRAPITAPSKESGGIPDPTPAYLVRASFLPKQREHPGPLLVVIDLNGTVLYRPSRRQASKFQARRHAHEFLTYCVKTFWVVFWSSARPENVRRMVSDLLPPDTLRQVVAVWGRDRFGLTPADYNARTQCYKRLTKLWDDPLIRSSYPQDRPGFEGGCWNQGNTVLIDDSTEKARSEPYNAITLPEFTGDMGEKWDILPMVHDYLNQLCYLEDVSAYMRANPFNMTFTGNANIKD